MNISVNSFSNCDNFCVAIYFIRIIKTKKMYVAEQNEKVVNFSQKTSNTFAMKCTISESQHS